MSENQPFIRQLLAAAGNDVGAVDTNNPVDVERFFRDIVMGANQLSDASFNALSAEVQNWLNAVTQAMNSNQDLIAASNAHGLELADLPTSAPAPVAQNNPSNAPESVAGCDKVQASEKSAESHDFAPVEAGELSSNEAVSKSNVNSTHRGDSMSEDTNDGKTPREPKQRSTFCVRFNGDEKERVLAFAKQSGSRSANRFVREAILEKCGIEPEN